VLGAEIRILCHQRFANFRLWHNPAALVTGQLIRLLG
jgi:hypothetical protein